MTTKIGKIDLKIGAVAYAPKVVTIWEGMREYLRGQGLMAEYVLYSSYPALVDALVTGHIDIAWNTPLAYLQAKERLDPDFFIPFKGERPHQIRLQGGDSSSDSFCFP